MVLVAAGLVMEVALGVRSQGWCLRHAARPGVGTTYLVVDTAAACGAHGVVTGSILVWRRGC